MACIKPPNNVSEPTVRAMGRLALRSSTLQAQTILGDQLIASQIPSASHLPSYLQVREVAHLVEADVVFPEDRTPLTAYVYKDVVYVTDEHSQLAYVDAKLALIPNPSRHPGPQAAAGASSPIGTMVGGHPVAVTLGGHPSMVEAQDQNMNVSLWATMENDFRAELRAGSEVRLQVQFAQDRSGAADSSVWVTTVTRGTQASEDYSFLNDSNQLK